MPEFFMYSSDTHFFIYKAKIASRYLGKAFEKTFGETRQYNFHISEDYRKLEPPKSTHNDVKYNQIVNDYESIINKTSNKNVIIFYRNPSEKLKSAIIQDFYNCFEPMSYKRLDTYLIFKHLNTPEYIKKFVIRNWHSYSFLDLKKIDSDILKFYKDALKVYLEHLSNSGYKTNHSPNYLFTIYPLIYSEMLDKNKYTLFNIDEYDIKVLFDDIEINTDNTFSSTNYNFKMLLEDILDENKYILDSFNHTIENELILYDMIKLHSNNFSLK